MPPRRFLDGAGTDPDRAAAFHEWVSAWLNDKASPEAIAASAAFSDFRADWHGVARYLRKKAEQPR